MDCDLLVAFHLDIRVDSEDLFHVHYDTTGIIVAWFGTP